MKKFLLLIVSMCCSINMAFSQVIFTSEHFIYKQIKNNVLVKPVGMVDKTLSKEEGLWKLDYDKLNWFEVRRTAFQDMIDKHIISRERMRELAEAKEEIAITLKFDETGIISYVYFVYNKKKGTLLTDDELYKISQAYLGKVYSVEGAVEVWQYDRGPIRRLTSFRGEDTFNIPFDELKF